MIHIYANNGGTVLGDWEWIRCSENYEQFIINIPKSESIESRS